MTKPKPKHKIGEWVEIVKGPNKGKSFTVDTSLYFNGGWSYSGYFCGHPIGARENEIRTYGEN
jgi:hypothetical protein